VLLECDTESLHVLCYVGWPQDKATQRKRKVDTELIICCSGPISSNSPAYTYRHCGTYLQATAVVVPGASC